MYPYKGCREQSEQILPGMSFFVLTSEAKMLTVECLENMRAWVAAAAL